MPEQQYERVIDLHDGSGVQRFVADSLEELADKLATAQENATRKIREQARQIKTGLGLVTPDPEQPVPDYKPKRRTADEEWRRAQEISDPSKTRDAIRSVVEDELGAPLDEVRDVMRTVKVAQRVNAAQLEVAEWIRDHPDYYACDENKEAILGYLESHNMALTKKNVTIAHDDLRDSGLLKARPEKQPENGSTPAPRPRSSSLRPGQGNERPVQTSTLTWADIDKMKPSVYDEKMRDAKFRAQVDALPRR